MSNAIRLTQGFVNVAGVTPGKRRCRYWDAVVPGLVLAVTSNGAKSYCAVYRDPVGRQREPRIGDARIVTLKQARTAALDILAKAQLEGRDPVAQRRAAQSKAELRRARIVKCLADEYFADAELRKAASRVSLEKISNRVHVQARFGEMPVADLTTEGIAKATLEIASSSGNGAANTALEVMRQMLQFACARSWINQNPALGIRAFPKLTRERVATDTELKAVWKGLETIKNDARSDAHAAACALQFALLTLQRRSEVAGLDAREMDWEAKVWTIPGPRTKNKKGPHSVPLSDEALAILEEAFGMRDTGFAFQGRDGEALEPKVMTRVMSRLTEAVAIEDLTVHDFRRTGATRMTERLGILGEVVSRILNHTPPGPAVTLVYNRNSYLAHKREALELWAKEVTRLRHVETKGFRGGTAADASRHPMA